MGLYDLINAVRVTCGALSVGPKGRPLGGLWAALGPKINQNHS